MLQLLYIIGIALALLWCICWCGTKWSDNQRRQKQNDNVSQEDIDLEEPYDPKVLSFKQAMHDISNV